MINGLKSKRCLVSGTSTKHKQYYRHRIKQNRLKENKNITPFEIDWTNNKNLYIYAN